MHDIFDAYVGSTGQGTALPSAVSWLQHLLIGEAATTIAVLAVAALGAAMLAGRVPVRRSVSVVIGCFIVFAAGYVADGIVRRPPATEPAIVAQAAEPIYIPSAPVPNPFDPYAGASVPQRATEPLPELR